MLQGDLRAFVRQLSKEKGLDAETVKEAIEDAIIQASKKTLSAHDGARCTLDLETGELKVTVEKTAAKWVQNVRTEITLEEARKIKPDAEEDDTVDIEIPPSAFGRIAAQTARQYVMQRLRDAERIKVSDEYGARVGEIVSGEVVRSERRDVIIMLPKGEARLPASETPYPHRHRPGDRMKLIITAVDSEARGPLVQLSRSHPQLIAKLFEQEVPEIADDVVEILGVAREPGIRSKIAVHSKNKDVDPVGACVGLKGSRVQMVVSELDGERIDIVAYDADPATFIRNALNPAEIVAVVCNEEDRTADVLVARGNLSLAIGKRGQNARLAAKLTGWKIDIRSEEEASDRALELAGAEIQRRYLEDFLAQIESVTDQHIDAFGKQEFNTVAKIAEAPVDRLVRVLGDEDLAKVVKTGAGEYNEALLEMQRGFEKEAAEAAAAEAEAKAAAGESAEGDTETVAESDTESVASAESAPESEETETASEAEEVENEPEKEPQA